MRIKGFCCVTGGPSSRHGTIIVSLNRAKGGLYQYVGVLRK